MEQIPDHPDIRKAENDGWGPEDDGLDDAIEYLEDVDQSICDALTSLEEAEVEFASHGVEIFMDDVIARLTTISMQIRNEISKYKL
jgi:hypothetical protein